jgi:hypothetical protein
MNEDDTSTSRPRKSNKVVNVNGLRNRRDRIIIDSIYVTDYRFDNENGSWCEIELQVI